MGRILLKCVKPAVAESKGWGRGTLSVKANRVHEGMEEIYLASREGREMMATDRTYNPPAKGWRVGGERVTAKWDRTGRQEPEKDSEPNGGAA